MSNITQADIDRAMEIINTPFGGDRGMAILSKSNYMYLCGMVQAMTKRIAELEKAVDMAAKWLSDFSGSCPSDVFDWEHPDTCINACEKYEKPDECWGCWKLWLLSLPAPPEPSRSSGRCAGN
jgi:hypothetical protein